MTLRLATFFFALVALPVMAADRPEWLPTALELPEDARISLNAEVGASARMLQFSTDEDADALLERWREALIGADYLIDQSLTQIEERQIQFSGPDVDSAQVVVLPAAGAGRVTLQIDATLNN
jgi:hypothetical protein